MCVCVRVCHFTPRPNNSMMFSFQSKHGGAVGGRDEETGGRET